jgi:hypothetical protein
MSEMNFDEQFERALKVGKEANESEARAVGAAYDPEGQLVVVQLRGGTLFSFPISWVPRLRDATETELSEVEVTPSGEALHWEKLDEDLSVPALIKGVYGPESFQVAELEQFAAELESAWYSEKDSSFVDQLAAANPQYSQQLYEIFGLLVDSEIDSEDSDGSGSAEAARAWLDAKGFDEVRRSSAESSTSTSAPPTRSLSDGRTEKSDVEEYAPKPNTNVLPFPDLLQKETGKDPDEAERELGLPEDLVFIVQQQAPGKQEKIRNEIADRAAQTYGLNREEGLASLEQPLRLAALDRSSKSKPSFRQQLAELEMSEQEREYWLSIADEEN